MKWLPVFSTLLVLTVRLGAAEKPAPASPPAAAPAPPTTAELTRATLDQAERALRRRAFGDTIGTTTAVLQGDPKNIRAYMLRGFAHAEARSFDKAAADFEALLKIEPQIAAAWQHLGFAHFKLGRVSEAVADFDRFLELMPAQRPYHWQRGIALYYAEKFEEGRKQFELHQTVNPADVENAAWHFLCVARASGLAPARASLIPISGDPRVPMTQIFALFAGKGSAAEVIAAAEAGQPTAEQLKDRLFYAHLYLGLYYEAEGDAKRAADHLEKAAGPYAQDHYMGDVARVHVKLLGKAKRKN